MAPARRGAVFVRIGTRGPRGRCAPADSSNPPGSWLRGMATRSVAMSKPSSERRVGTSHGHAARCHATNSARIRRHTQGDDRPCGAGVIAVQGRLGTARVRPRTGRPGAGDAATPGDHLSNRVDPPTQSRRVIPDGSIGIIRPSAIALPVLPGGTPVSLGIESPMSARPLLLTHSRRADGRGRRPEGRSIRPSIAAGLRGGRPLPPGDRRGRRPERPDGDRGPDHRQRIDRRGPHPRQDPDPGRTAIGPEHGGARPPRLEEHPVVLARPGHLPRRPGPRRDRPDLPAPGDARHPIGRVPRAIQDQRIEARRIDRPEGRRPRRLRPDPIGRLADPPSL